MWIKPWKEIKYWLKLKIDQIEDLSIENLSIETSSNRIDKELKIKMYIKNYANILKSILKIKNSQVFCIDGAKNSKTPNVATMRFFNVKTKAINWYSDKHIDIIDAKLFAIETTIEFCAKKAYSIKIVSNIWILTNCVNTITRLKKFEFRTHLMEKLHRNCKELYEIDYKIHIYWISKLKTRKNLEKSTSRRTSKKEIKKDRKSRQFYVILIFKEKN